jgi:TATA-box binding protein (TBP) (component of TFIID and TFIIIB)
MITYQIKKQGDAFMTEILNIASQVPAQISTITISIKIDNEFNLARITSDFENSTIQDFIYAITGNKQSIEISNKKQFNNSIIFKCNNIPTDTDGYILDKQAVKVFCNGSLHITGVKDIKDALYLAEVFTTMIELVYGGDGVSNMFNIVGFEIQLMNFYFKLPGMVDGKVLRLVDVLKYLRKNTKYAISYNNERHAGIIIRSPTFSLLIFDTGNVIICSIKETSQLVEAREFILHKLYVLPEKFIIDKECISRKRHKKDDPEFDYSKYLVLK